MTAALAIAALTVAVVIYATRGWAEAGTRLDDVVAEVTHTGYVTVTDRDQLRAVLGMHGPESQRRAIAELVDIAEWQEEMDQ